MENNIDEVQGNIQNPADDKHTVQTSNEKHENIELTEVKGINLALDPNLITLPIYKSSNTPGTNPNLTSSEIEPNNDLSNDNTTSNTTPTYMGESLINNPHEIFGQMPLTQLIPLILKQQGPGFRFADLSEESLRYEISKENMNNNLALHIEDKSKNINSIHEEINSELNNNTKIGLDTEITSDTDAMDIDFEDKNVISGNNKLEQNSSRFHPTGNDEDDISNTNVEEEDGSLLDGSNKDDTIELTQERFIKIRKEMLENINMALNETSLSLEFVSLLLSATRESVATSSMSPYLKKTVPTGSLNSDHILIEGKSQAELKHLETLDRGWKLQALDESSEILKKTHSKLKNILFKEHKYWNNLSKSIGNKDVIFKLRDRSTGERYLGIKYGYEDSGSTYRYDQGTARLKANPETNRLELMPIDRNENEISLDSKQNERFIRIRIYTKIEGEDDYILSGETAPGKIFVDNAEHGKENSRDIRDQIERLKAFIFEQELMYQLKRECSLLISYGVILEAESKIVIELPKEKFEIEYLKLTDDTVINHEQDAPRTNDKRALLMLITFRMLLTMIFKKTLRERLTSAKRSDKLVPERDILLIRPILGSMRHNNYKVLLRKILTDNIIDVIEGCVIREVAVNRKADDECIMDRHIMKLSNEIKSFNKLLNTWSSKFVINIPEKGTFDILLESPNYCNAVVSIKYSDLLSNISFDTKFNEFKEIEEFIIFIVSEYIENSENSIKKE
ncbi:hypothetical protein TBLA_0F02870 [Henningerozyma blattae CBS 6284]|uniref:Mediator of RNA polymerase II transcription subunit 17 n=1 Tax=Henningerozyma blattae (strain ATCC 34711 / CBS 6284 / DSM 70876 / NBRC 10599 / NRRL Y-10934 / UCD 77-7) TaxID=1071380 RepID=I2H624_HENB6|nr:hypothetical protein TBLA_0F02870 [Tetrapisispora blattae CBS 6284]CCH61826.1 hypothetical protein TBLA_0F02870 [Tetrapisispora blattae CBS 6284]